MKSKIQMWGHSLGLRIPKSFAAEAHLKKNSVIDISYEDGKLVITPFRRAAKTLEALLEKVTAQNLHGEMDFGPPSGREAW